ncbi:MAG: hypothetical protein AAFY71_28550, partial [Bacteroidota bacterium]
MSIHRYDSVEELREFFKDNLSPSNVVAHLEKMIPLFVNQSTQNDLSVMKKNLNEIQPSNKFERLIALFFSKTIILSESEIRFLFQVLVSFDSFLKGTLIIKPNEFNSFG